MGHDAFTFKNMVFLQLVDNTFFRLIRVPPKCCLAFFTVQLVNVYAWQRVEKNQNPMSTMVCIPVSFHLHYFSWWPWLARQKVMKNPKLLVVFRTLGGTNLSMWISVSVTTVQVRNYPTFWTFPLLLHPRERKLREIFLMAYRH